jgi:hypothetical protein
MANSICIVTEAMEAYQAFCKIIPKSVPIAFDVEIADEDQRTFAKWIEAHHMTQPNKWWKLKPAEEIVSMLYDLPLTKEAYQEVSEFLKAASMRDPYEAHGCGP